MLTTIGHYTFYIPREGCPLSGREIDDLLTKNRIRHSRVGMFVDVEGDIHLNVPKSQAGKAQALFDQHGITVLVPYTEKKPRTWKPSQQARRPRGRPVREPGDPFAEIFDSVFERR